MFSFDVEVSFTPGTRVVSPLTGRIGAMVAHTAAMINMQMRWLSSPVEYISVLQNEGAKGMKKFVSL